MADTDVDIGELTEEQQLALQQFTAVTDQDVSTAVPLLRRCEWNVQIAVTRFLDGEPPEPVQEEAPPAPVQATRRSEVLMNGFHQERFSSQNQLEPAPRVVTQPQSQANQQAPLILSLLLTPINVLYGLFSRAFGFISYLFPFLPRLLGGLASRASSTRSRINAGARRPLGPQDTTARFLREFEEEYGANTLPFLETGYARAFDIAKKELKFLLAITLSPEHDDTSHFVKDVLLSESVSTFLNDPANNVILWAGSVQDSEAYQVADALKITKYPAAVLIVHTPSVSSTSMSVVARVSGATTPDEFITKIRAAVTQYSEPLQHARAQQREQQAARDLREEQNSAYERSLATDRERARQRREAAAAKEKEDQEEKERQEAEERYERNLAQWKRWRAQTIKPEPAADVKDAVRISIRLQDGQRLVRKFEPSVPIEELYAFVECNEVLEEVQSSEKEIPPPTGFTYSPSFRLVSPMPREVYDLEAGGNVREKIGRSGNLIVERIESEEEDD